MNNKKLSISSHILFQPILIYLFGYLIFHFIPPFFSDLGHNWFIILLDLCAITFFSIGVVDGFIFKRVFVGRNFKIKIGSKDFSLLLFILFCLIYLLRIYQFKLSGIYALFHPFASEVTLLTTMKGILVKPFILVLWYGSIVRKKKFCYFLLFLEFLFMLLIMSRSSIFTFFLCGMVVYVFFKGLPRKKLKQFILISVVLISLMALAGPTMHAMRSIIYVHKISSLSNVGVSRISAEKAKNFLINRLNIHKNYRLIEGYEDYVARVDLESLKSILPKLLGFAKEYKVRPVSVTSIIGHKIGFIKSKTATGFPRNIILFYMGGWLAIILFSIVFGSIFGLLFDLFYLSGNLLFPAFYFPLAWGFIFNQNGLIGATAFQMLFVICTYSVPIILFYGLKTMRVCCMKTRCL